LRQLLHNAINAVESTPDQTGWVRVRGLDEDDDLVIAVQDSGIGIAKEDLRRIFHHHRGSLHDCAIAVHTMGGSLEAHSDGESCGALFRIRIPKQPIDDGILLDDHLAVS